MSPPFETYFSPDYGAARDRFRDAARTAGAALDQLAIEARGPRAESLTIDIARLGARGARQVLLHTSGLHGVEAFAGAVAKRALLEALCPGAAEWRRRAVERGLSLLRAAAAWMFHGQT